MRGLLAAYRALLQRPPFRRELIISCAGAGAGFTYVATSSFALQGGAWGQGHLTPRGYATVFTANAVALTLVSLAFRALVTTRGPRRLQVLGAVASAAAAAALTVVAAVAAATHHGAIPLTGLVLPLLAVAVAGAGLTAPATAVLAQQAGGDAPGAAAALQGGASYLTGALVSPLLGVVGAPTVLAMAAAMALFSAG